MRGLTFEMDEWLMSKVGGGGMGWSMMIMNITNWWEEINESVGWQDGVFFTLSTLFALVSSVALVQLIRNQLRVPEYGCTTQKAFHLMNFIVNGVRAIVFGFHKQIFNLSPKVLILVLLDLPGLLFFSTYTLLVLFWAEVYHQARGLPANKLRHFYVLINAGIYFIQVCIWIFLRLFEKGIVVGRIFVAAVSFVAALGFLVYGGRLFKMLQEFPIESTARRKRLHEVGSVTAICFTCFLVRCFMVIISAIDSDASLDVLDHPILDFFYYTVFLTLSLYILVIFQPSLFTYNNNIPRGVPPKWDLRKIVEILPSALVLFILRKLPPKRLSAQYHPIH